MARGIVHVNNRNLYRADDNNNNNEVTKKRITILIIKADSIINIFFFGCIQRKKKKRLYIDRRMAVCLCFSVVFIVLATSCRKKQKGNYLLVTTPGANKMRCNIISGDRMK